MFLYMMAFMLTSVVEQAFYVVVSDFHQYNNIATHAVPLVLALFLGAWSDRRGRKLPLILGLLGKLYFSTMIIVNAMQGKYLWSSVVGRSYAIMFAINASLLLAATVYAFLFLQWHTTASQKPVPRNCLGDFFDLDHVRQSVRAVVRKRPGYRHEKQMSYLYTQLQFHWTAETYSDYRTYQNASYVIAPVLRSMTSKVVPLSERGESDVARLHEILLDKRSWSFILPLVVQQPFSGPDRPNDSPPSIPSSTILLHLPISVHLLHIVAIFLEIFQLLDYHRQC
ncbi:hypothetical protein C0J52_19648 [Blattella germanica]|nr:hypothetical protein C0J52_19648 [Blattella germanica]